MIDKMTPIEEDLSCMMVDCINEWLTDGVDNGEWLFEFGKKQYVVEYLPASPGYHMRLTLSEPDESNDDHKLKHKFVMEIKITEIDIKE